MGVPWATICKGLSTFISDSQAVPGRFNVFDFKGATVIADYGHNPDAIKALVQAVTNLPAQRRSVVISGAGDRRDEDIREQTRIIGEAFDDVVLYQDACQRGRVDERDAQIGIAGVGAVAPALNRTAVMTKELFWLTLTAAMTGLIWVPYILDRVMVRGLMGSMANPSPNDDASVPFAVTCPRAARPARSMDSAPWRQSATFTVP